MTPRRLIRLGVCVGLGLLLGASLKFEPHMLASTTVGMPARAFTLPQLLEPTRTLAPANLRDRVWLLNVWASWCAPCRDEQPLLLALADENVVPIYGMNYRDDPRDAQEWLRRLGNPYTASVSDRDGHVGRDYGVHAVPVTFVIDRNGIVRLEHVGPITREIWAREFLPLIRRLQA